MWGRVSQLISGDWKWQSQCMVWPGAHFKTGLKSVSYGNALFTDYFVPGGCYQLLSVGESGRKRVW